MFQQELRFYRIDNYKDWKELLPDHSVEATDPDLTFRWYDPLNIAMGLLEGSMGAVPSSLYNYQCGKNATLARTYLMDTVTDFSKSEKTDGVKQLAKMLALTDDLTINCAQAIGDNANTNIYAIFTSNQVFMNLLYNAGFMFTDILDLVYYDSSNSNSYYYYASYRAGDFLVRFVYADTT